MTLSKVADFSQLLSKATASISKTKASTSFLICLNGFPTSQSSSVPVRVYVLNYTGHKLISVVGGCREICCHLRGSLCRRPIGSRWWISRAEITRWGGFKTSFIIPHREFHLFRMSDKVLKCTVRGKNIWHQFISWQDLGWSVGLFNLMPFIQKGSEVSSQPDTKRVWRDHPFI